MLKPEDVADYLKQNPAFFDRHLDLLTEAKAGEEVTPFHERQLSVLKQRHEAQQARYEEVVESARNNQALESTLHGLVVKLLSSPQRDRDTAIDILVERFDLTAAAIIDGEENRKDESLDQVRKRVAHGSSICDDRVASALRVALFGGEAEIGSCAFVPMTLGSGPRGVLVLGAASSERFQPGMGPIYLDRIGELVGAFLASRS